MIEFGELEIPADGHRIEIIEDKMSVPDDPIIPLIEGDGTGPDVTRAMQPVVDAAVHEAYEGDRRVVWLNIHAGEAAFRTYGGLLPEDTLKAIEYFHVAIKGPLTTPVDSEYRDLNTAISQELDLFACIWPVKYTRGVPSPVVAPEKVDMIIFRENFGAEITSMSEFATKRLVRMAIRYAIKHQRRSVTLVHKDDNMECAENTFRQWGYAVAREEFADAVINEDGSSSPGSYVSAVDRIIIKDRSAGDMLQQVLTRPDEYDVIVAPGPAGDYLAGVCAAQVGGLSMVPGANLGEGIAVFEATHGSAPEDADKNIANPSSLILSAAMMLEYMGWNEAAELVTGALSNTILQIYDGRLVYSTSQFASVIIENLKRAYRLMSL
jgi:isocitrate dehydrogenase